MFVTSEQNISIFSYTNGIHHSENVQNIVGFNDEIIDIKYAKNQQDLIIMATNSSLIKVYDSSQNKYQTKLLSRYNFLDFHSETVMCVDMVGCYLTSGSKDKSIKLFELVDRKSLEFRLVASFTGHSETVSSLALAPCTQNWITSVSSDRSIKVWKVDKRAVGSIFRESER